MRGTHRGISYACGFAVGGGDQPATLGMAREASVRPSVGWPLAATALTGVRARSAHYSSPSDSDLVHPGWLHRASSGLQGIRFAPI
jgi:hypothetical protein